MYVERILSRTSDLKKTFKDILIVVRLPFLRARKNLDPMRLDKRQSDESKSILWLLYLEEGGNCVTNEVIHREDVFCHTD